MDLTTIVSSLIVLSLISIVLNCACISVIKRKISLTEKPSTILILNLLITHLFQGIFVFPMYAGKKMKVKDLFWARFFNTGFLFTYMLSFYGVCLGVLSISFDRFLATYLLNRYKVYVTFRNIVRFLIGTWIYVIVLCLIPFIPTASKKDVKINTTSAAIVGNFSMNLATNSTNSASSEKRIKYNFYLPQNEWTVFMLFLNAALPLLLIVLCYIYVVYRLKQLENTRSGHSNTTNGTTGKFGTNTSEKVKGFKKYKEITQLSMILTSIYFIMWSPSVIYYTLLSVCDQRCFVQNWDNSVAEKHVVYIIKYLSFLNAILSPILYCFRHPDMKILLNKKKKHTLLQSSNGLELKEGSSPKIIIK